MQEIRDKVLAILAPNFDELYDILGVPLVLSPIPRPTSVEFHLPVIPPPPLYDVTTNAKLSAVSNE